MRRDPTEFRKRFALWKKGKSAKDIYKLSDLDYYEYMERLSDKKATEWNNVPIRADLDIRLTQMLNDNTYNYKEFYNNNRYEANGMLYENPDAHFTDSGKTVYHPTFSKESNYSGKKSDYNPEGIVGGSWEDNWFNVSPLQVTSRYFSENKTKQYLKDNDPDVKLKLPRFGSGKEGYKYVQAGKNNEWSRITDDDMSQAFQDLVVRPLSRGGNTTVGNWKRLWTPKYEKPLESISPEFDIISGIRGITNMLLSKKTIEKTVESTTKDQLDWSTWSKGGKISKQHLKEYEDIIKKYQNTPQWLMMEDGSKFRGDPRSWIQLMSKDAKKAGLRNSTFPSYENIVYSGVRSGKINPEYMETQWTSRSPLIARSYAPNDNAVQQLIFPRSKYISTFDANGNYWPAIKTPQGPVVKAGDIVRYSKTTNSPLEIRNLSDHGPYFPYKSKYKTAEFNYNNGTFSDDIILHEGYPRKSILFNNGDFDLTNPNIYKTLTPLVIGYGIHNKYAE